MKSILHFSNWAPSKSGLYECTKDQVKMERKAGLNSQFAIYNTKDPVGYVDDWLTPVSWDFAEQADIFVIHRGLPAEISQKFPNTKKVIVLHGTSEYLLLDDIFSGGEKQGFNSHINYINNYDGASVVNQHDYDILKLYDYNDKLRMIHDAIDMERYNLNGYKYPYKNHPQILYCDSLRINKNPAHIIWAMEDIVKEIPTAKLTVVGLSMNDILIWRNLILRSKRGSLNSHCEAIQFRTDDIIPYMRGADILINGNMSGIPSRVEMEAMACGCQVISYNGDFSKFQPKAFDIKDIARKVIDCCNYIKEDEEKSIKEVQEYAHNHFNMETKVNEEYIPFYNQILNK